MEVYTLREWNQCFRTQCHWTHVGSWINFYIWTLFARHRFIRKIYVNTLMLIMENLQTSGTVWSHSLDMFWGITGLPSLPFPLCKNVNSVEKAQLILDIIFENNFDIMDSLTWFLKFLDVWGHILSMTVLGLVYPRERRVYSFLL